MSLSFTVGYLYPSMYLPIINTAPETILLCCDAETHPDLLLPEQKVFRRLHFLTHEEMRTPGKIMITACVSFCLALAKSESSLHVGRLSE